MRPFAPRLLVALFALLLILAGSAPRAMAQAAAAPAAAQAPASNLPAGIYSLDQFGPVASAAQAQQSYQAACKQILAAGGGILIIPPATFARWTPVNNTQESLRTPPPPAPAKNWSFGPGITILDYRGGTLHIMPPQSTGLQIDRSYDLPQGQSAPHWNYNPALMINNEVLHGSTSYRDWLEEPVTAGADRRFYVRTTRGIFPGMFLNSGDHGRVSRLYVKSLGYDVVKHMPYFTADIDFDLKKGALLHNKTHVNAFKAETYAHTENQTFDMMVVRNHYSQGDTYLFDAYFNYMGDVHSTAGDENGVCFAAFVEGESNIFRGKTEAYESPSGQLKYTGASNAHTLGSGRPLINLNPKKWITAGSVVLVRPGTWWDDSAKHLNNPVYQGKSYPTEVVKDAARGAELRMGGLIRFSADAPVDAAAVGRYLAIDEADEYVPGGDKVRRWFQIWSVTVNPDKTKDVQIIRHWWGARPANGITLYNPENYSQDGSVHPLKYIIAPGSNVYDVSRGTGSGPQFSQGARERILMLTPNSQQGTDVDFAPGDDLEQAIGPDPFHPIPFRTFTFDKVPGAFPAPIFDVANFGSVSRYSVLAIRGGSGNLDEIAKRADKDTPWQVGIKIESATHHGIQFAGDVADAAIEFQQPHNRAQPITWLYEDGAKKASLTVSPTDGTMTYQGGGVKLPGGLSGVRGISGSDTAARNLRGVNIAVPAGAKEIKVAFPNPEADADYAVFLELTWLTNKAVVEQTPQGFTVQFEQAPAKDARLHWVLVR